MALGNSKSAPDTQTWGYSLAGKLATATTDLWRAIEMGRGGYTVQKINDNLTLNNDGSQFNAAIINDVISNCGTTNATRLEKCQLALGTVQQPTYILLDVGVNDVGFIPPWALPNQTTWQNNYLAILDTLHAQWPDALIYITKPWKRQAGGNEALFDTMAGWIDNVVAARAFARVGDDERIWFAQNADMYSSDTNGDRIHFNADGAVAAASAKLTALGF